jgi:D-glycero-beta-D-manno-heptose 1-phosphate adenylyltransferase
MQPNMPNQINVDDILNPNLDPAKRIIRSHEELKDIVSKLKERGLKIVLTQGVWDLIHEGHAKYLDRANREGDVLIVGVDSDELTRKRKGPRRPIVPEDERIRMVSYLRCVHIITTRNVNEPIGKLIRIVRPDTLVVSKATKDFSTKEKNAYKSVCGKVLNLEPQAVTSSTGRIRLLAIDGAKELAEKISCFVEDFLRDQDCHEPKKQ